MASSGEQTGTEIPIDIARLPVGAALRARREQLGWGLSEVAAWLRIKLAYLEALEGGQVSRLPGTAYAMGFLRAYASALGLDADDMMRRFRSETKDVVRKPELSFPVPVPERGVPAGAIVLLGVVMVVAAYVGWYELGGRLSHQAHTVPPVPDALAPYATTGRGTSPQVATVMPGPGQTPSPLPPSAADARPADQPTQRPAGSTPETAGVAAEMVRPTPAPATVSPTAPAATGAVATAAPAVQPAGTVVAPGTAAVVAGGAAPATAAVAQPTTVAAPPPAAAGQITLNAVTNCWVQVRQVAGKVIYDHVLQAGEHWSVPAGAGDVLLSTGNAGGLTVSADGVTSPVLGRVGGVRRGIPLTAEAVRNGSIAAASPFSGDATGPSATQPAVPAAAGVPPSSAAASTPAAGASTPGGGAASIRSGTGAPMFHPHTVVHRPAAPQGDDETDRLNRAQLKQPTPPQ